MREKGITAYRLGKMGFPQSNYYAIKRGENISTHTLNLSLIHIFRMKKLQKLNFSTFQFFHARGDILEMQQSTLADWCDLNTEAKKE